MNIEFLPLTSFVILTTFTPGPNNTTSAIFGINYGYQKSLKFLVGIATRFFVIMLISALFSNIFSEFLNQYQKYIKFFGTIYILYFAYSLIKKIDFSQNHKLNNFWNSFILQFLNTKVIIYGLVLYTTFLTPISNNIILLILFSFIFAIVSFTSINIWNIFGNTLHRNI